MKFYSDAVNQIKKPKAKLVLGLAVAAGGFMIPHSSHEDASQPTGCVSGDYGDCVQVVNGVDRACTSGWFWNDCGYNVST